MRRLATVAGAVLALLFVAPAAASADVLFDPADADELAATLAEAYEGQRVCYGWRVDVDNVGMRETSVGSNFGAGQPLDETVDPEACRTTVEFQATITWTSESSESEDSASYQVLSLPTGPTTSDLDSLELISDDGLAGENPDVDVYKAVSALPLLAADAGVADALEASPAPETEAEAANGQPTNSPGSDFWRRAGGAIMWSALLILGGGVFALWAIKSSRGSARRRAASAPEEPGGPTPEFVPAEWYDPNTAPQGNVRPGPPPPPYQPSPPATPPTRKPTGRRRPTTERRPPETPTDPSATGSPAAGPRTGRSPAAGPGATKPPTTEQPGTEPSATGPRSTASPAAEPGAAEPGERAESGAPAGAPKPTDRDAQAAGAAGERDEDQTPPGGSAEKPAGKPDPETRPEG